MSRMWRKQKTAEEGVITSLRSRQTKRAPNEKCSFSITPLFQDVNSLAKGNGNVETAATTITIAWGKFIKYHPGLICTSRLVQAKVAKYHNTQAIYKCSKSLTRQASLSLVSKLSYVN